MDETVAHEKLDDDPSLELLELLQSVDLQRCSFVQLRRLKKELGAAGIRVEEEFVRRTDDEGGDTVQIEKPTP